MLDFRNKKVLVIAPHLDDIELGMGGTLFKLINEYSADIRYVGLSLPPLVKKVEFMEEFDKSNEFFQIPKKNYVLKEFDPRNLFEDRVKILQLFYDINKDFQPQFVFTTNSKDIHQSHQVVFEESRRAFKYSTILGYELPWNSFEFNLNVFIELSEQEIQIKQNAINAFSTQQNRMFFSNDIIIDLAKVRGKQVGLVFAECFELIRLIHKI